MWGTITGWLDLKLINSWRSALRFRIIQLHLAITGAAAAVYNLAKAYPDLAQTMVSKLPPELLKPVFVNVLLAVWLLIGAYARLAPQVKKPDGPAQP
jgi:hypothetical protein